MVDCSGSAFKAADPGTDEATMYSPRQPSGSKTEKTRAQKEAHNARCRESRKKLKRRREELEKTETEHIKMVPEYNHMRAQCQGMEKELQEKNSKIQRMENEIQELKRALQKQAAKEERMRLIPGGWMVNGQSFSSFDESVEWFASQTYEQVGEEGSDYTNLSASSADNSFFANHQWPSLIGSPNDNLFAHNSAAGLLAASDAGPSSVANNGLSFVFGVPQNDGNNNIFSEHGYDLIASAAGSSTDHDLPALFDAADDLISPPADYQPGFPSGGNPFSRAL